MTTAPSRRWVGLLLGLAGVLLTGCTMAGARGATISTISRATSGTGDCPPATVTGTAPGLDPAQEANAKTVVGVALGRGLGPTGAAIAVAAALAESSLYNYANDGTSTLVGSAEGRQLNDSERAVARQSLTYPHDKVGNNLDSIGLFQQRPMTGWGTPAELINPATATGKFLDQMVKVAGWQTLSPWTVAQKVQGSPSSDGGIYRDSYQRATAIVAALDTGPADSGQQSIGRRRPGRVTGATCGQPVQAASAGGGSAAWGGYQNGRIPAQRAVPRPSGAGPATRMRRRDRVRPAQHRLQSRLRAEHRHHRRLPLLRRTSPMPTGKGQPVRQPRHLQPRLGQSRRHRRLLRHQQRHRPGLRLAHHQRRPLRLEPPRLGASRRLQTRTLALGIRRHLMTSASWPPSSPRRRNQSTGGTAAGPDGRNEPMMDPRLAKVIDTRQLTYTIEQVSELLGISRATAYQLARDGVIPARRIGRRWMVPRKALHDWLDHLPAA